MKLNEYLSRAAAIVLVVLVISAIYIVFIQPAQKLYAKNHQEILRLTEHLEKFRNISTSRKNIEQQLKSMSLHGNEMDYYLKGGTKALASAELQAYIRGVIESANGNLVSTQPIEKGERDSEQLVKVHVRMSGNIETLQQVFYQISTGLPVLLTDDVAIVRGIAVRARSGANDDMAMLDAQFTLTGFVKESGS